MSLGFVSHLDLNSSVSAYYNSSVVTYVLEMSLNGMQEKLSFSVIFQYSIIYTHPLKHSFHCTRRNYNLTAEFQSNLRYITDCYLFIEILMSRFHNLQ